MPKPARERIVFPTRWESMLPRKISSDSVIRAGAIIKRILEDLGDVLDAIEASPYEFKGISWQDIEQSSTGVQDLGSLIDLIVDRCSSISSAYDGAISRRGHEAARDLAAS